MLNTHRFLAPWLLVLVPAVATPGSAQAEDWPQLLGPHRNGVYDGALTAAWPASGPQRLWRHELGTGFSGPAVSQGRVFIYHRRGDRAIVEALDAGSGERQWSFEHSTDYVDQLGFDDGPRATPTIAGGRVFTWSALGKLHALDFETGKMLWAVDAHQRFGADQGTFGAASSPLYDGGRLIVNVGGPEGAGIVAFDAGSGEVLWQISDDAAGYGSPVAANLNGRRRVLVWTSKRLYELDPANGEVGATFPWRARTNAVNPLVVGNRIFLSANYGKGAVLLDAGGKELKPVWSSNEAMSNHYAISVHHQGYLYGFHGMALSRTSAGVNLRCVALESGEVIWEWSETGAGTVLLAGSQLVVLTDAGELILAPASPEGFEPAARAKILESPVRAAPALAAGHLFARDPKQLIAVDLSSQQGH